MRPVAFHLVVEGVINGDGVVAMVVYRIGQQLEAHTVSSAIVSARVPP